jgi:2-oxoisovalerate dehydrogenase E1 component alpha subunit
MIVTNNEWGISTPASEQHGEKHIADRAKAFGIKTDVIDGNDPETSYRELKKAMDYVRTERKAVPPRGDGVAPLRALVGVGGELRHRRVDCLPLFEKKLEERKVLTRARWTSSRAKHDAGAARGEQARPDEPQPEGRPDLASTSSPSDVVAEGGAGRPRARQRPGTGLAEMATSFRRCASRSTSARRASA